MQSRILSTFAEEGAASAGGEATAEEPVKVSSSDKYNILSLDGGGIRGIITAAVIDKMENLAYEKALIVYKIPARTEKKVSMAELFDMVAGTSTGALLAATLVIPKSSDPKMPKYYANDFMEDFKLRGGDIFVREEFDWAKFSLIVCLTFVACFAVGYALGKSKFQSQNTEELIDHLREYVKKLKYNKLSQHGSRTMTEGEALAGFGMSINDQLHNALLSKYNDLADYEHKV